MSPTIGPAGEPGISSGWRAVTAAIDRVLPETSLKRALAMLSPADTLDSHFCRSD